MITEKNSKIQARTAPSQAPLPDSMPQPGQKEDNPKPVSRGTPGCSWSLCFQLIKTSPTYPQEIPKVRRASRQDQLVGANLVSVPAHDRHIHQVALSSQAAEGVHQGTVVVVPQDAVLAPVHLASVLRGWEWESVLAVVMLLPSL